MDEVSTGSDINLHQDALAGKAARVRNPSGDRSLIFDLPTTGYKDLKYSYAVTRTASGQLTNRIAYSIDGINFIQTGLGQTDFSVQATYNLVSVDFSNIPEVNNNPNFKIKITFIGNTTASNGNNRFDNIALKGVKIPAPLPPMITSTTAGSVCNTGSVTTLRATASNGTINWYQAPVGGTPLGSGNSFTTPTLNAPKIYYVDAVGNQAVTVTRTPVNVTIVTTIPTITSTTAAEKCGSGILSLQATNSNMSVAQWYASSSSETPLGTGNTFNTPSLAATTTYYVSALNACGFSLTRTPVTATIKPLPLIASTTNAEICGNGGLSLQASADNGQVRWYAASSGGSALTTSNTYTTPALGNTTIYYAEALNNGCVSATRTPVTATIYSLPEAPITGGNKATCVSSATVLVPTATAAANTTLAWYDAASGGNVVNSPSLSSVGTITYYAASKSINNCLSQNRTPVKLTIAAAADCFEDGGYVACDAPTTYFHQSVEMQGLSNWHEHGNAVEVKPGAVVTFSNGFSYTFGNHATCFTNNGAWLASSGALHYFKGIGDNLISGSTAPKFYQANFSNVVNKMYIHNQQGIEIQHLLNFENGITATLRSKHDLGAIKFLDQANYAGQMNTQRYVDGYISKSGTAPFTFPIGHKGNYRPLKIENGTDNTRTISTAWIEGDPNTINSTKDGLLHQTNKYDTNDLKGVSTIGQWDWIVNNGNTTGTVVSVALPDNITAFASTNLLRLVGWNGTQWVNLSANNGASGTWLSGTILPNITAIGIGKSCVDPVITQQPLAGTYCKNAVAQPLSVSTNESNLSYQWYQYTSLENQVPTEIAAATSAIFTPPTNVAGTFYYQAKAFSQSSCAVLSEIVSVIINDLPMITSTTAQQGCQGSSLNLSASANLGTINWYETLTGEVPIASGNNFPTPDLYATTTYYVGATNSCGTSQRVAVIATIIPLPIVTSTTASNRCGDGSVVIQAYTNSGQLRWFATTTAETPLDTGNTFTTPVLNSTTSYYVEVIDNGCISNPRTPVLATIKPLPTISSTTEASRCGEGSVVLQAIPSNGQIRWYSTATGGAPMLAGSTFTTPFLSNTTTYYAGAIHNECISAVRTAIVATINDPMASITSTTPAEMCGTGSVTLQATTNNNGIVKWFATPTSETALASGNSFSTPILDATTTYYVSSLNSCGFSTPRIAITASIKQIPNITSTTNAPICTGNNLVVSVPATAGATYLWSGPNSFSNTNNSWSISNATTASSGTYTITVNLNGCTATTTVVNMVNATPVVNTTPPVEVCTGSPLQLNVNNTAGATYSWTGPNLFSSIAEDPQVSDATTSDMAGTYSVTVNLGSCSANGQVVVNINPSPVLVITNQNTTGNGAVNITLPAVTSGSTMPSGTILTYFTNLLGTNVLTSPTAVANSGTYYIKATSLAACTDIKPIVVNICGSEITLISPIDDFSTGIQTKASNAKITAANKITGTAKVTYRSAQAIELKPGFFAASGTVFLAEKGTCN